MDASGNIYFSEGEVPKEDQERLMEALREDFVDMRDRIAKLAADTQHFADTLKDD